MALLAAVLGASEVTGTMLVVCEREEVLLSLFLVVPDDSADCFFPAAGVVLLLF